MGAILPGFGPNNDRAADSFTEAVYRTIGTAFPRNNLYENPQNNAPTNIARQNANQGDSAYRHEYTPAAKTIAISSAIHRERKNLELSGLAGVGGSIFGHMAQIAT